MANSLIFILFIYYSIFFDEPDIPAKKASVWWWWWWLLPGRELSACVVSEVGIYCIYQHIIRYTACYFSTASCFLRAVSHAIGV